MEFFDSLINFFLYVCILSNICREGTLIELNGKVTVPGTAELTVD